MTQAAVQCEAGLTSGFANTTHLSAHEDTWTGLSADVANVYGTQRENRLISIVIDCDASLTGPGGTEPHSESDDGDQSPDRSPKVPGTGGLAASWPEADLVAVYSPNHSRVISAEGDTFSTASATDPSPFVGPVGPRSWDTMGQHATAVTETHNAGTLSSSAALSLEPAAPAERLASSRLPADPAQGRPTHSTTNLETLSEAGTDLDVDTTEVDLQSVHSSVVSPGRRPGTTRTSAFLSVTALRHPQEESLVASQDVCSSSTLSDTDTEVDSDLDPAEGECESDPELEGGQRSPHPPRPGRDGDGPTTTSSREHTVDPSEGCLLSLEPAGEVSPAAPTESGRHCAKCHATMGSEAWWPSMKPADCPKGGKHQWVSKGRAPSADGLYYSVHASVKEGMMLHHASRWRTYRIYLAGVCKAFGPAWNRWNANYPAAQQIFGSNVMSKSMRGLIHAEYSSLFTEQVGCTSGRLQTGQDLLKLLNYGLRHGVPHLYTYVILADRLHFSETGQSALKDMLSKHALLANAQREVRYSGEFHIQPFAPPRDGSSSPHRLIVDNDSGTYAPTAELLPVVKALLEANFPGLEVEALDRTDPRLVRFKEELRALRSKSSAGLFSTCYDVDCAHGPDDVPSQEALTGSLGNSLALASCAVTDDGQGMGLEAEGPDSPSLRSTMSPAAA
eukprot:EG_transcript_4229